MVQLPVTTAIECRRWALFPQGAFVRGSFSPGSFSPWVFCLGAHLAGGIFVRTNWGLLSRGAFPGGTFSPGDFCPGALLAGGIFVREGFCPGGLLSGGLLPGGTLVQGLMPVHPNFNAYTHRLGFLCLAWSMFTLLVVVHRWPSRSVTDKQKKTNSAP